MNVTAKNTVAEISWQRTTFITSRSVQPFNQLSSFFSEKYGALYSTLGRMGIQIVDPPCAIYYSVDEKTMVTDLAAAVPVPEDTPEIENFTKVIVPASRAVTATHYGSYDSMGETYDQLESYLAQHKLRKVWAIEQYLSDPVKERPADWKTNIYLGVEPNPDI